MQANVCTFEGLDINLSPEGTEQSKRWPQRQDLHQLERLKGHASAGLAMERVLASNRALKGGLGKTGAPICEKPGE